MITPGQSIPEINLKLATAEGPKDVNTAALFAGKNAIMFSVPGAFTPTCSKQLPEYVAEAELLHKKGINLIVCLSVNDAFTMQAWAEANNVGDKVTMLCDGSALFAKALGIEVDLAAPQMGLRARRGVMHIQNGVVKSVDMEAPGKFEVSGVLACAARL